MESAPVFHPTRSKYLIVTLDYLVPLLICLSLVFGIWYALATPYFQIKIVNCTLDFEPCKDPGLIAELDKLKGRNVFTLNPTKISARLTSGDFTIRQAEVIRKLPGEIEIKVQSVYPVVALKLARDDTWITFDATYRVIGPRETDPNVPTVIIQGPLTLTVGKPLNDETIQKALGLARTLSDQLFTVKTITLVDGDTINITLSSGVVAIFTPKKDELIQLETLQAVLADGTISGGVHEVDVRFSQPVLR